MQQPTYDAQSRLAFRDLVKDPVKALFNRHVPDGSPNVFVVTMPRSGSTWLMELIGDQPGFKTCSEPLNIRLPLVRRHLGARRWHDLHEPSLTESMRRYFEAFCDGSLHFLDPIPLRSNVYRFRSRRIVFKVIHGGEERIEWFRDTFNGRIVYLLRHPIPVAISHEVYPRLSAYVESPYREHFTADQVALATEIIASGSRLQKGVLAWCFENAVPLRTRAADWTVVTYEQLVLEPRPIIDLLIDRLELDDPSRMLDNLDRASGVKRKSDAATQALLERRDQDARRRLVDKWRRSVDHEEEVRLMEILERFGIAAYRAGDDLPHTDLWIGPGRPASGA